MFQKYRQFSVAFLCTHHFCFRFKSYKSILYLFYNNCDCETISVLYLYFFCSWLFQPPLMLFDVNKNDSNILRHFQKMTMYYNFLYCSLKSLYIFLWDFRTKNKEFFMGIYTEILFATSLKKEALLHNMMTCTSRKIPISLHSLTNVRLIYKPSKVKYRK